MNKKAADSDRRSLLYNYYSHGFGNPTGGLDLNKRNFDEIDRLGGFNDFDKRNFDEIDRLGFGDF